MGAREFGQLVDAARSERGWSLARVAVEIGVLPEGRALNETQTKRILEGKRQLDRWIVERLIEVLDLDPAHAWAAAGLLPPHTTPEDIRYLLDLREPVFAAEQRARRQAKYAAAKAADRAARQGARRSPAGAPVDPDGPTRHRATPRVAAQVLQLVRPAAQAPTVVESAA